MIKRFIILFVALLAISESFAYDYDFKSGNGAGTIYYKLDNIKYEATVVAGDWEYSGNVVIPESVTVGNITYNVTTIGKQAFYYCYDLASVTLGSNVTTIKTQAFERVSGPNSTGIIINLDSDALTSIESNAFHCAVLAPNYGDTLALGKNIQTLGGQSNYFSWTTFPNVKHFYVDGSSSSLCTDADGVLYSKDMKKLYYYPPYLDGTTYEIPSSIETIATYAFYSMQKLKTITGGENVTSIGSVVSGSVLTLPIGPKVNTMSTDALMYAHADFLPVIDENNKTFALVDNVLYKYESKDTTLCRYFKCNKQATFVVPANVTKIGSYAFYNHQYIQNIDYGQCTKLKSSNIASTAYHSTKYSVNFLNAQNIYVVIDGVYYSDDTVTMVMYGSDVTLEDYVMPAKTNTITVSTLKTNGYAKTFAINKVASSINGEYLYPLENLERYSVDPANATYSSDGHGVLYNKAKTKLISYPRGNTSLFYKVADGTTQIGVHAFYQNKYLKGLDLGDDITSVVDGNSGNMANMKLLNYIRVGAMQPPTVTTSSFSSDMYTKNTILYVPEAAFEIYKNASIWNRFAVVKDTGQFLSDVMNTKQTYYTEHYKQNITGDGFEAPESVKCEGYLLRPTTAEARDYEGFTALPFEQKTLDANDVIVKIYYTRNNYNITWKASGTPVSSGTYPYGTKIEAPDVVVNVPSGKYFVGWNSKESATTTLNFDEYSLLRYDTTFYAVFASLDSKPYTVRHFLQNIDGTYPTEPNETEGGFGTIGSYTEAVAKSYEGFSLRESIQQQEITEDGAVVNIRYSRNSYTITWKNGSETITGSSGSFLYDTELRIPSKNPTPAAGKHFVGWNDDPYATVALSLEGTKVKESVTYYAIFADNDIKTYIVKHILENVDGTYPATPADTDYGYGKFGEQTTATARKYTGFSAPSKIVQKTIAEKGFTTVEIKYTRNKYNIAWYNGQTLLSSESGEYKYGSDLLIPADPSAEAGMHFVGWNTEKNAGVALSLAGTTVDTAKTYYALFAPNASTVYHVEHLLQNIDDNNYTADPIIDEKSGSFGAQTNAAARTYTGFTLKEAVVQDVIKEDGTTVIQIKYDRVVYDIAWYDGETKIVNESGQYRYGATLQIPADRNAEAGMHFVGWNTNKDADGAMSLNGTTVEGSATYYAIFADNASTVYHVEHLLQNIYDNNYTADPATDEKFGSFGSQTNAVARTYTGFTLRDSVIQAVIAQDGSTVIHIKYDRVEYDVAWYDGETKIENESGKYRYGATLQIPTDREAAAGKHFAGWNTIKGSTEGLTLGTLVVESATYYASYADNDTKPYTVNHYQESLDGTTYSLKESETGEGVWGLSTNAKAKTYTGYTLKEAVVQDIIKEDGTTVINIYYNRNIYDITWKIGDQTYDSNTGVKYGSTLDVPSDPEAAAGKHFVGWSTDKNSNVALTLTGAKVEGNATYYAIFANNDTKPYTVKHYQENLDGTTYSLKESEAGEGIWGLSTNAKAKTYTGFTLKEAVVQDIIKEDGTTVINIYYNRNIYDITWMNGDQTYDSKTGVKYGSDLSVPSDPEAAAGKHFVGWNTDKNSNVALNLTGAKVEGKTIYYAIFADNATKSYIVYHYFENLDGTYPSSTTIFDNGTGAWGLETNAVAKQETGFTAQKFSQAIILENNSTVVKIYYKRNKHNLVWITTNGTIGSGSYTKDSVKYGTPIIEPVLTRTGYTHKGWALTDAAEFASEIATTMPDADLTYYVVWELLKFPVSWWWNDENNFHNISYVDYGEPIKWEGGVPNRDHYKFLGWSATQNGAVINDGNYGVMGTQEVSFYAQWEANKNNISWYGNGGVLSGTYTSGSIGFGTPIVKPTASRIGYTLVGWGTSADATSAIEVPTSMPDENVDYYAIWKINQHTLTWNANSGELSGTYTSGTVAYGTTITVPSASRYGYTFKGWTTTLGSTETVEISTMPDDNVTYYAVWEANQHTLVWEANGGELSGTYTSGTVAYGTTIVAPTNVSRTGYKFAGWGESATSTNPTTVASTMPDNDVKYYALWVVNDYVVEWLMNDGTDKIYGSNNVTFGNAISKIEPDPAREHYQFLGWSKASNGNVTTDFGTMNANKVTFYAKWQINSNNLVWNANGGELSGEYTKGAVAYGIEIAKPTATRTGYSFVGWGTTADATIAVDISTMPDNDVEYFAIWSVNSYDVDWKFNDGSTLNYKTTSFEYGEPIAKPDDPEYEHYTFMGWSTTADGAVISDFGTMPAKDTAFYAVWELNTHSLSWNGNGGELSGEYTNGTVAYGTEVVEPTANRTGYSLAGWGTTADATIAVETETMPDNDVEYFAIWSLNSYNVEWKLNDGTTSSYKTSPFKYGEAIARPDVDPTRDHYTFLGWSDAVDGAAISDFGTMPAKDTAFYAVWELNTHSLSWNGNGGELSGEYTNGTVAYGTEVVEPTATRTGYSLVGWGTTSDATIAVETETMPDNDVEYFAIWKINKHFAVWYANNGTNDTIKVDTLDYETMIVAPVTTPTRDHYTFLGWSDAVDGAAISDFSTMPDKDTAFYAVWELNKHVTVWYANNGTNDTVKVDTLEYGIAIADPANDPTRANYAFVGWAATTDGDALTDFGTMPDKDTAFYAVWALNKHVVVWHKNDGTGDKFQRDVLDFGDEIVAPSENPTRDNYTFMGWSAADGEVTTEFGTMPDQDTAFYAVWLINKHFAVWCANDGTNDTIKVDTLDFGAVIIAPSEKPTRDNYAFMGWSATTGGTIISDFGTMPDQDTAFYAVWNINKHVANWYANDGTNDKVNVDTLDFGTVIMAPSEKPTRENYKFIGWSATADGDTTSVFGTMPDKDTAFYAVWENLMFDAVWYANNGTAEIFFTTHASVSTTLTAPETSPVRDNYTFKGWSATADGEVTTVFGEMPAGGTQFYAIWEDVMYDAVWYANNGTAEIFFTTHASVSSTLTAPEANPVRDNYTFKGWSSTADGEVTTSFGVMPAGGTQFYAIWEDILYDAVWYANNGTAEIFFTTHATVSSTLTAPEGTPDHGSYIFKGWSSTADGEPLTDFGVMPAGGTSFYAVWAPGEFTVVWDMNDGSGKTYLSQQVVLGEKIVAPNDNPSRKCYEFKGWSATADGDVTTDFGVMTADGAIFYAIWAGIVEFEAPESFETCENDKYVELTNVSDSVKFTWKVNGVVEPSQVGTIFTLPDNAKFSGTITVTGSFGGTEVTKEIKYIRKKDMITTMWDDVVSVINADNMFQSYKWYHNDALIDTTEYYNEVGGLTGKYYLVATTSDGEEICSCERDFGKKPEASISVYPNPAVERVLVKGNALEVGKSIFITDENGKVWLSREITDNNVEEISLSNLPQGLYIVKIDNKSISFIKL